MSTGSADPVGLAEAFTREHREIDAGIERFLSTGPGTGAAAAREHAAPLLRSMEALRRHIYLEEEFVFPRISSGPLMMPVMVMLREHGELWQQMDDLAARIEGNASGTDADGITAACRDLLSLLEAHNAKEEAVIYPHLDADLDEDEQATVRRLLETGSLPEGWTCRNA